jgi:CheY-like chemotaxis protein
MSINTTTASTLSLRILVIDDSPLHRRAAEETLAGYDLTVVSTYDEAATLLGRPILGGESSRPDLPFDVVLADLLMPAGNYRLSPEGERFVGQEMPVGFALALQAVLSGAKYVAVVTATNHHDHPASALLDQLGGDYWRDDSNREPRTRAKFNINGATVGFFHHPKYYVADKEVCDVCSGSGRLSKDLSCCFCEGTGKRGEIKTETKDWKKVLDRLLEGVE